MWVDISSVESIPSFIYLNFWHAYVFEKQLFVLSETLRRRILMLNQWWWTAVTGFRDRLVACSRLTSIFDDPTGSSEQMGFKRLLTQTGYRRCVGLVLSGAGIKWWSLPPRYSDGGRDPVVRPEEEKVFLWSVSRPYYHTGLNYWIITSCQSSGNHYSSISLTWIIRRKWGFPVSCCFSKAESQYWLVQWMQLFVITCRVLR